MPWFTDNQNIDPEGKLIYKDLLDFGEFTVDNKSPYCDIDLGNNSEDSDCES